MMKSKTIILRTFLSFLFLQGLGEINTIGSVNSHSLLGEAPVTTNGDQYYASKVSMLPVYVDCCDNSSEWRPVQVVLSDVNTWEGERAYLCGDQRLQSILVQKRPETNLGYMSKEFDPLMDLSGNAFEVRFKILMASDDSSYEYFSGIQIRFTDLAGSFAQYDIPHNSPGWQRRQCTLTDTSDARGNIDWTQVKTCTIIIRTQEIGYQPSIIVDRIVFFRPAPSMCSLFNKPIVINTFDDGHESHYEAAAYLSGKCMPGTFYIIGQTVDWGERLTLAELTDMHWAGHLITNHTWSHHLLFNELTPAEQIAEVTRMQIFMCENGFADGARILSLPGNEWTAPVRDLLSPYVDQVRGNPGGFSYQRNLMVDPTLLSPTAELDTIIDKIEQALDPNEIPTIVVFMEHDLTNNMAEFKAYVDYLAQKRDAGLLNVLTPVDLLVWHDQSLVSESYPQVNN